MVSKPVEVLVSFMPFGCCVRGTVIKPARFARPAVFMSSQSRKPFQRCIEVRHACTAPYTSIS